MGRLACRRRRPRRDFDTVAVTSAVRSATPSRPRRSWSSSAVKGARVWTTPHRRHRLRLVASNCPARCHRDHLCQHGPRRGGGRSDSSAMRSTTTTLVTFIAATSFPSSDQGEWRDPNLRAGGLLGRGYPPGHPPRYAQFSRAGECLGGDCVRVLRAGAVSFAHVSPRSGITRASGPGCDGGCLVWTVAPGLPSCDAPPSRKGWCDRYAFGAAWRAPVSGCATDRLHVGTALLRERPPWSCIQLLGPL